MTDIVTYCDVNTCEDCPRYSDECDGDKRVEHTDLISRADAIKAVASITMSIHLSDVICDKLLALPSADTEPKRVLQGYCKGANTIKTIRHEELTQIANTRKAVESADADGEDLIIKGAKGIQDGLYNIKDGKLFKYKAKGGTVRTYPIVPSADAVQGEWEFVDNEIFAGEYFCSICGKRAEVDLYGEWILSNYCGHCGARMKGGAK